MKRRTSPVGQYIFDGLGDIDESDEYIEELMPLIGGLVVLFSALESDLDHFLCERVSDRSDQKGLFVLNSMMYATKVDLYERFTSDELRICGWEIEGYDELLSALRECGTLRNRVVHANWQYTDHEGFTQVRIRATKHGLEHELWQFSIESMNEILGKLQTTREALDEFEEECAYRATLWNNEIASRQQRSENDSDA